VETGEKREHGRRIAYREEKRNKTGYLTISSLQTKSNFSKENPSQMYRSFKPISSGKIHTLLSELANMACYNREPSFKR